MKLIFCITDIFFSIFKYILEIKHCQRQTTTLVFITCLITIGNFFFKTLLRYYKLIAKIEKENLSRLTAVFAQLLYFCFHPSDKKLHGYKRLHLVSIKLKSRSVTIKSHRNTQ